MFRSISSENFVAIRLRKLWTIFMTWKMDIPEKNDQMYLILVARLLKQK